MIQFRLAERKFARAARLSLLGLLTAASSVASMPLQRPVLPDPQFPFAVSRDLFLAPAALQAMPRFIALSVPRVAWLSPPAIDVKPPVGQKEIACLATAIYFEARGEPETGQEAVGQVILNRVVSTAYPDTICGVVYQNAKRHNACQFSFACDGKPDTVKEKSAWRQAETVAAELVEGRIDAGAAITATHYHATTVSPRWAGKLKRVARIGRHIFYAG